MAAKTPAPSYTEELKQTFTTMIDGLALEPPQKTYLRARWLDQVTWFESKASKAQARYYRLRLVTVVGAVILPALIGLTSLADPWDGAVRVLTWVVALVTAASAAIEGFFRYGERWRNYRSTAEQLKTEGWRYFQLAGPYSVDGAGHGALYGAFANRVEEIITSDVQVYVTEIAADRSKDGERPDKGG
jgi:hypothetical protein